jgi:beta-1,4-mannosyl-glycoprotein beta-1,4-N-acetylglucosaminyltransferase
MVYEFCYMHDEVDWLDVRLHEAGDLVDYFVIAECPFDCMHRPKPLSFELNKERFKDFLHKIIYIVAEDVTVINVNMVRTRLAECRKGFVNCKPDDILILADPDFVINKQTYIDIRNSADILENHEIQLVANWYFYHMDGLFTKEKFICCSAFKRKNTVDSEWGTVNRWKPVGKTIYGAGWHFSKMGGAEELAEHIDGYPHGHCDYPNLFGRDATIKLMQERIDNGYCWEGGYPGECVVEYIPYDPKNYPAYVNEHPEIYARYFKYGMGGNK